MVAKLSKLVRSAVIGSALVIWLVACGSSDQEDPNGISAETSIQSISISSTGDNVTSARIELVDDGDSQRDFLVTLTPIVDADASGPLDASDAGRISVESAASDQTVTAIFSNKEGELTGEPCDAKIDFGAGTASGADVAFIVDTTGSMGNAVTGIADSIEDFAQELDAAGLGVRFSFVTFGDAYDTKLTMGSGYTLGTGADVPPPLDSVERPLLDFTSSLTDFNAFVEEVRMNVGFGAGGGDGPENYYGVAAAMNTKPSSGSGGTEPPLSRRSDVPFYQILVGDNCGHSEEIPGATLDSAWEPPSVLELGTVLGDGSVTVHTVEREGFDSELGCQEDQVTLDEISDATGGAKLEFPASGEVDLSAIDLAEFITNFWLVTIDSECVPKAAEAITLDLLVTVDDGGTERAQIFTFGMTLGTTPTGMTPALVSAL